MILLTLGIVLPFLLVTIIPSYFFDDVGAFHIWATCLQQNSQNIYPLCKPDYPTTGMLFSGGAIYLIKTLISTTDRGSIDAVFRYYLAVFDALNFLLLIWLAKLLQFRFPVTIALAILAMPSTWVGGAVWGQIDGISLFFCLLATLGFFQFWQALRNHAIAVSIIMKYRDKRINKGLKPLVPVVGVPRSFEYCYNGKFSFYTWDKLQSYIGNFFWLLLATTSLAIYLLSKQLTLFSLPFFSAIALININKIQHYYHKKGIVISIFFVLLFVASFSFLDSLFIMPEGFHNSSYWFGWNQGFKPYISGNGFNIWMFLGWPMSASPYLPFAQLNLGFWQAEISPYAAGIVLYAIFMASLILTGFKAVRRLLQANRENREKADSYLMALLCLFQGLSYLGFNVFLTGTNERYLHLGYPFLLLAVTWFYQQNILFSWRLLVFCFAAAFAYGLFVFSIIHPLPDLLFVFKSHEFIGSIHLFLLLILGDIWWGICRRTKNSDQ